eukprot:8205984-Karenia_brevis.AAC.1
MKQYSACLPLGMQYPSFCTSADVINKCVQSKGVHGVSPCQGCSDFIVICLLHTGMQEYFCK